MANLDHSHHWQAIRERLENVGSPNYVRDFIYGSIDGTVTTFAIVSGVVGAGLANHTIIILGLANVFADGFSMAASNYLATRSEVDERELIHLYEKTQIKENPLGEKEEIRQIFYAKGFRGDDLEKIVNVVSQNEHEWLKIMLQEEYGIGLNVRNPWKSGISTFIAFVICGLLPLFPFIFNLDHSFLISSIIAGISFFVVGALKSQWSLESFYVSGIKTFLIGLISSLIAYFAGSFLEGRFLS